MGRLMLNVLLSFAQFEREIISERTRDKIAAARRKGKWSGGLPLLGYSVVDTKLVVDPAEAEQVRQIFELYLQLEGLIRVVAELNRRNWRTKRWTTKKGIERGGRPFDKNSLWYLLANVTYIGKVKYKDEVHQGEHEAIVANELWQQVQVKLHRNGRSGGAAVRNKFGAALKGLLHCTHCGCAMCPTHATRDGNRRYRYYVCSAAQKRGRNTCPSDSLPASEIERFVVEQIKCIGTDPDLVAETVKQVQAQAVQRANELAIEERRLGRELAGNHSDLQKLVKGGPNDGDSHAAARLADIQERLTVAERRLTEVRNEAERLRREQIDGAEVARAMVEFDPVWESLNPREQSRLLHLLIERIDYDGNDGTISITFQVNGIKALANQNIEGNAA
jgi:site-specific DNA recombinase